MVHNQEKDLSIFQKNWKTEIENRLTPEEEMGELLPFVALQEIPEWEIRETLEEVSSAVFCDRPIDCFSNQIFQEKCLCIRRQFQSLASYTDFRQKIALQVEGLLLGELTNGTNQTE